MIDLLVLKKEEKKVWGGDLVFFDVSRFSHRVFSAETGPRIKVRNRLTRPRSEQYF